MAKYIIPKQFLPGFELIMQLSKKQLDAMKNALIKAPIGSKPEEIAQNLEGEIKYNIIDIRNILSTIFSLISLYVREGISKSEFIEDILASYTENKPEIKENDKEKLENNLTILLEADGNIKHTIKALTLQRENEKVFIDSRILSDIRIVFEENIENTSQCAIILHHLKIEYYENDEYKEFFVTLDKKDLKQLNDSVERAINKDNLIRNKTYKVFSFIDLNKK